MHLPNWIKDNWVVGAALLATAPGALLFGVPAPFTGLPASIQSGYQAQTAGHVTVRDICATVKQEAKFSKHQSDLQQMLNSCRKLDD